MSEMCTTIWMSVKMKCTTHRNGYQNKQTKLVKRLKENIDADNWEMHHSEPLYSDGRSWS